MLWDPAKDKEIKPISKEAEMLYKAADFLEGHDWCRGNYHKDGAYCFMGAISEANGILPITPEMDYLMLAISRNRLITEPRKGYPIHMIDWNDLYAKDKQEVIDKMREIASKL